MKDILTRLQSGEVLIGDGAMGTMLMERGLKPGECPEAININNPLVLEEIASLYLKAGADILQTNTFGGSPLKLADYNLEDKMEDINKNAVLAVQKVADGKAYVSASCGPSGKMLKPHGDADPDDIYKSYSKQMKVVIEQGVDLICVETMTDLDEATLAIKAARSISSSIPIMATMTFDATKRGYFTVMGVNIEKAAKGLVAAGADIIGSNCGNGIERMIEIATEFKKNTDKPLIIQSNAGLPRMEGDRLVYDESPEFMADRAVKLLDLKVSIIGGCCGTTPEHIAALKKIILLNKK